MLVRSVPVEDVEVYLVLVITPTMTFWHRSGYQRCYSQLKLHTSFTTGCYQFASEIFVVDVLHLAFARRYSGLFGSEICSGYIAAASMYTRGKGVEMGRSGMCNIAGLASIHIP